jgi:phosphatidate cytidylyltransferase
MAIPVARLATGIVLIALVLACLFLLPKVAAYSLFLVFLTVAAYEWSALAGIVTTPLRVGYAGTVGVGLALGWQFMRSPLFVELLLFGGAVWWLCASAWVIAFQLRGGPVIRKRFALAVLGPIVLLPAMCSIVYLLERSPNHVVAVLVLVWSMDIWAYFGGRRFGRTALASRVSPGKTREGLVIAAVTTVVLAVLGNTLVSQYPHPTWFILITLTMFAAVIGDLFESLLKRIQGVKDSGSLLPGHGGVLDRIDSILAAAPVFALTLHLMETK